MSGSPVPTLNDFGGGIIATSMPGAWIAGIRYAIKPYACLVTKTGAAQSIPNNSWTSIQWDTEVVDTNAMFAATSDTITINASGIYGVSSYLGFVANGTGRRILAIVINGVFRDLKSVISDGAVTNHLGTTGVFSLSVGDAVTIRAWQDSGAGLNTNTNETPHFDVVYHSAL